MARVYTQPVHIKDASGQWVNIDPSLVAGSDGRLRPVATSAGLDLAPTSGASMLGHLALDASHSIGWTVAGADSVQAKVVSQTVIYPSVLPNVDLQLKSVASGLKESFVLSSPAAPDTFVLPLSLTGLTAKVDPATGNVNLLDGGGTKVGIIPHGRMEDSNVDPHVGEGVISTAVTYTVVSYQGGQALQMALDRGWLNDPARVYPVTEDPTITNYNGSTDDTFVMSGTSANNSADSKLKVGTYDSGTNVAATYVHVNGISALPANAHIYSALFEMYERWSWSCTPRNASVYLVTQGWDGTTMNGYPGASYNSTPIDTQNFAMGYSSTLCSSGWAGWDVSSAVRQWVSGTPNYGLTVRVPAGSESDNYAWKYFDSADDGDPPYINVYYTPDWAKWGSFTQMVAPTNNTTGSIQISVQNLATAWPANGTVRVSYHLYNASGQYLGDGPRTYMPTTVPNGGWITLNAQIQALAPASYTLDWDIVNEGYAWFKDEGAIPVQPIALTVLNQPPIMTSLWMNAAPAASGQTVYSTGPLLQMGGYDPDNWPGGGVQYAYQICTGSDASSGTCWNPGWLTNSTYQLPWGSLNWGQWYYWIAGIYDGYSVYITPVMAFFTEMPPLNAGHFGADAYSITNGGVNPATGDFVTAMTDATLQGAGLEPSLVRTYNSQDTRTTNLFGTGWQTPFDMSVGAGVASTLFNVYYPDGRQEVFGQNPDGSFVAALGYYAQLNAVTGGGYSLLDPSGMTYVFNAQGKLTSMTDAAGHTETLSYSSGLLSSVTSSTSGRSLTFAWNGGHVSSVTTPNVTTTGSSLTWNYTYENSNSLKTVCSPMPGPANCTTFGYDYGTSTLGILNSVVLPRGNTNVSLTYNSDRSVHTRSDGLNHTWSYSYNPGSTESRTTVTDPNGQTTVYAYDPMNGNRLIRYQDAQGQIETYAYSANGYLLSVTDANNHSVVLQTDSHGNVLSRSTVMGGTTYSSYYQYFSPRYEAENATNNLTFGSLATSASSPTPYSGTGYLWMFGNSGQYVTFNVNAAVAGSNQLNFRYFGASASSREIDVNGVDVNPALALPATTSNAWATVSTTVNLVVGSNTITMAYGAASGGWIGVDYLDVLPGGRADPRTNRVIAAADGRSASVTNTTYQTTYAYDGGGNLVSTTAPTTSDGPASTSTKAFTTGSEAAYGGGGTMPAGLLLSEVAPNNQGTNAKTTYAYDTKGDLRQVIDPVGLQSLYAYDGLGRKVSANQISDSYPAGVITQYNYDPMSRLAVQSDPPVPNPVTGVTHTAVTTNGYDANGDLATVTVSDATGGDAARTTVYSYDADDRVTRTVDPAQDVTSTTFDALGNVASVTDPLGTLTTYANSSRNQLVTTTVVNFVDDPVNHSAPRNVVTDVRTYDPAGRLSTETDALGRTTQYQYFEDDLVSSVTLLGFHNPGGTTRSFVEHQYQYDGAGDATTDLGANGLHLVTATYDAAGRLWTQSVDPNGVSQVTTRTYDADGNVKVTTFVDATHRTRQVSAVYDAADRPVTSTLYSDTIGNLVTLYSRDQRGLVTANTDPRGTQPGATPASFTSHATYDVLGRLSSSTTPPLLVESAGGPPVVQASTTTYGYDTFGEQTGVRDPLGAQTLRTYDPDGRQLQEVDPGFTNPGSTATVSPTRSWTYDAAGNPATQVDPRSQTTSFIYDARHRVVDRYDPQVAGQPARGVTVFTYDDASNLLSSTDPTGAKTLLGYDDLNRLTTSTVVERTPTPANETTTYRLDDLGNVTSTTTPAGETSSAVFDAIGEPVTETDAVGNVTALSYSRGQLVSVKDPLGRATLYSYDRAGPLFAEVHLDQNGQILDAAYYGFDPALNPASLVTPNGWTTSYNYDAANRLTQVTQETAGVPNGMATATTTVSAGYDAVGNRTRVTDGNSNPRISTYNAEGWLASEIVPTTTADPSVGHATATYAYDAGGNVLTQGAGGLVTTTSTFDALGRQVSQSGAGAEAATATRNLSYDLGSRLTGVSGPGVTETLNYNDRGDVVGAAGYAGNVSYTYDADNRLAATSDVGGTSSYTYYANGLLKTDTNPMTGLATYNYDPASQLTSLSMGGSGRSYGYDGRGRLTTDTVTTGPTMVYSTLYGYDLDSNLTSQTIGPNGVAGTGASHYTYDAADRLQAYGSPSGVTTTYGYDSAGNRTGAGAATFSYNPRNELVTSTVVGGANPGTTTYTYTPRGTMSSSVAPAGPTSTVTSTFTSDAFNRLVQAVGTAYAYDGLDRMVTRAGVTLTYDGLSQQQTADGTYTYSYDPSGTPVAYRSGSTNLSTISDRHSDVVAGFSPGATSTAFALQYDPFGAVVGTTGASKPSLGFQGSYVDPATGLVDTQSRWYSGLTGAFLQQDSYRPQLTSVGAANLYSYGNGNPLAGTDVTGHFCFYCDIETVVQGIKTGGEVVGEGATTVGDLLGGAALPVTVACAVFCDQSGIMKDVEGCPQACVTNPLKPGYGPYQGEKVDGPPYPGPGPASPDLPANPSPTIPSTGNANRVGSHPSRTGSTSVSSSSHPSPIPHYPAPQSASIPQTLYTTASAPLPSLAPISAASIAIASPAPQAFVAPVASGNQLCGGPLAPPGCAQSGGSDVPQGPFPECAEGESLATCTPERPPGSPETATGGQGGGSGTDGQPPTEAPACVPDSPGNSGQNPVYPSSPAGMDQLTGLNGTPVPDGPATSGRGKVVWNTPQGKITFEQHPYHPNAPEWHRGPHWHIDPPCGPAHQRRLPGDPFP